MRRGGEIDMSTLERAIVIAAEAHAGQVDKAGAPYVLHPLRMMLRVSSIDERLSDGPVAGSAGLDVRPGEVPRFAAADCIAFC
jgi:hypothetical protein